MVPIGFGIVVGSSCVVTGSAMRGVTTVKVVLVRACIVVIARRAVSFSLGFGKCCRASVHLANDSTSAGLAGYGARGVFRTAVVFRAVVVFHMVVVLYTVAVTVAVFRANESAFDWIISFGWVDLAGLAGAFGLVGVYYMKSCKNLVIRLVGGIDTPHTIDSIRRIGMINVVDTIGRAIDIVGTIGSADIVNGVCVRSFDCEVQVWGEL